MFLKPAYDAMSDDLGAVATFECAGATRPKVPDGRAFLCTAVFLGGRTGGRTVVFDERGAVADEIDLAADETFNPGIPCTSRTDLDPTLPDCDDVPAEVEPGPLPPTDHALFGKPPRITKLGRPSPGEPGNPADCVPDGADQIVTVKVLCPEAQRVAARVAEDRACRPAEGADEHRCDFERYFCDMNAGADETDPWSASCSTVPRAAQTNDSDVVSFDVPPPT